MIAEGDIRAELIIQHDHHLIDVCHVRKDGRFHDGYKADLFDISKSDCRLCLSRDGIMQSLPEGLFFDENSLVKEKYDSDQIKEQDGILQQQRKDLRAFFSGFDNIFFERELELHDCLNSIETERDYFILKNLYGIDLHRQESPLVRKLMRSAIDADFVKGNLNLIPLLVRSILDVEMHFYINKKVVDNDEDSLCYTEVKFVLIIERLSNHDYNKRMHEYELFFSWLENLFMPFDCELDYCIKDYSQRFVLQDQITLDYNTQL